MPAKRRFLQNWNLDKTLSLMAFLISLGTFFLLYYQTRLSQKQQYASVLPYLEIFNQNPRTEDYIFTLVNNGIGPAFIEKVEILYENKRFRMDPVNFIDSEIYPKDSVNFSYTNLPEGKLLAPGKQLELLVVQDSEKDANVLRALFGRSKAILEITYSSVYGEKWVVGSGNSPEKLDK